MLHRAEVFLTPAEQEHREVSGRLFIETYCKLASDAVSAKQKLWRTRPKFHLFDHMVSDSRPSLLNPTFGSTWMDEDAIKRWFRIKKRVHKRNATLNCLRRWLLALPGQLQKACAKDNWDDFPKFSFWCGLKVKKIYHFFCSMLLSQAYWLTLKRPCTHICLEKKTDSQMNLGWCLWSLLLQISWVYMMVSEIFMYVKIYLYKYISSKNLSCRRSCLEATSKT